MKEPEDPLMSVDRFLQIENRANVAQALKNFKGAVGGGGEMR